MTIINVDVGATAEERIAMAVSLWVCQRCSTVIRSDATPKECFEDQGGCRRGSEDAEFLGPFPEGAKAALEIDATYRKLRLEDGLTEPQALEAIERDDRIWADWESSSGLHGEEGIGPFRVIVRKILATSCLLDEWPIGWREEEWEALAKWMAFEDVEYWISRVVDTSETNLLIAPILAAQGHLAPLLKAIVSAFHGIPVSGRYSAGKSRCGEMLTYLGGGEWFESASVAGLKRVRKDGSTVVGVDEGDQAERDNPGVKAYLLASHNWGARYLKYGDPNEKGKRELETLLYGGPVFITFTKKPWPAIASRAHIMEMEPSTRYGVSDDGDGEGFRRLLGPARIWLRKRCEEALHGKNELWAMRRTHEPDFVVRLNRVYAGASILRQRGFARMVLFVAELLSLDMTIVEERLTQTIQDQEIESENATIIEAVELDEFYVEAMRTGGELEVQALRLRVQATLRNAREFVDLSRNRFAAVLTEMGFSKAKGPTWKRVKREGRQFMVIIPGMLPKDGAQGATPATPATPPHMEEGSTGHTGSTGSTPIEGQNPDRMFATEFALNAVKVHPSIPVGFCYEDALKAYRTKFNKDPDLDELRAGVISGLKSAMADRDAEGSS